MLYDRISEMKAEIQTLHERVTEKEVDIKLLCNRVNEINVIEFEAECDRKLLKATEDRFDEERQQLLKQIEDLSNAPKTGQSASASVPSSPKPPTYSEVLQWSTVKHKGHRSTQKLDAVDSSSVNISNRFSNLVDQAEKLCIDNMPSDSASQPSPPRTRTPKTISSATCVKGKAMSDNATHSTTCEPHAVILGDSIARRIDSKRLLKNAKVTNLSKGGRRIEQVCDDVDSHGPVISSATTLIFHIGTNNLNSDTIDEVQGKLHRLRDTVMARASSNCEVAFSSLIRRKDSQDCKVDTVNMVISQMCDENGWAYIDNSAIKKDMLADNVHPNSRGMSFLARNFQDFLRCVHPNLFPRTIYPKWVTYLMT